MLGASTVMGWGVGDGETFEALLEDRLNRDKANAPAATDEILAFGVPAYQPPQQLVALDRALSFSPNAVYYVATGQEMTRSALYLAEAVQKRIEIPYAPLRELVTRAGITPSMDNAPSLKRLDPLSADILSWIYRRIADETRARGALPVMIFLPQVREEPGQDEVPHI